MDYTNNPSVNKQPDASNMQFLAELYGTFPGSGNEAVVARSETVPPGDRRLLRQKPETRELPDWLLDSWKDVIPQIENRVGVTEHDDGWRLLHRCLHGEAHEYDLGNGYALQVHKLLVVDEEPAGE